MTIVQGTTPTHSFEIPFKAENIKTARFVYSQNGTVICTKTGEDVTFTEEGEVATTLTQEETYNFAQGTQVKLQLRLLLLDGHALASRPVWLLCVGCDCKEVLE